MLDRSTKGRKIPATPNHTQETRMIHTRYDNLPSCNNSYGGGASKGPDGQYYGTTTKQSQMGGKVGYTREDHIFPGTVRNTVSAGEKAVKGFPQKN